MDNLLDVLYVYLQETRLSTSFASPEYRARCHRKADHEKALREALPAGVLPDLDTLLEDILRLHLYEQDAVFQAALSLGLELSRL